MLNTFQTPELKVKNPAIGLEIFGCSFSAILLQLRRHWDLSFVQNA